MEKATLLVFMEKENRAGYDALKAYDGSVKVCRFEDAPAMSAKCAVELAMIDCGNRPEEGLQLLREIKLLRPDVPVIFITDASSEEVVLKAFKYGAREYFKKPLEMVEFNVAVENILRFRRNGPGERLLPAGAKNGDIPAPIRVPDALPDRLLRVIDYIEQNLAAPLYLDELARQACLSKYHFCRMFKKQFGSSPLQFMLALRIRQAASLLRGAGAVTISYVALRAGFSDLSEFNKQFKRVTGLTPSAYRKSA